MTAHRAERLRQVRLLHLDRMRLYRRSIWKTFKERKGFEVVRSPVKLELDAARLYRRFTGMVLESDAFARVVDVQSNTALSESLLILLFRLAELETLSPAQLRKLSEYAQRAEEDAATAVKVLRLYGGDNPLESSMREAFLKAADDIEQNSSLLSVLTAMQEGKLAEANQLLKFDFRMLGKHANKRALWIRLIAERVPKETKNRYAAISELMNYAMLAGAPSAFGVSPALVRSTLLQGRT